jgi:prophage endopeptidase
MNRYLIAAAVALFTVIGLYRYGFHKGWSERDAEMQAQIAAKNEHARQLEQALNEQLNTTTAKLQEANNVVNEKQSALDRAIRAGRVRLPAPSCVQAPADAAAPAGNRDEETSESDRETLRLIAQIAADGDRAITQLNACIDAYNEVREQLNGSNH